MEQLAKKLMNWASILEDQTRQQAERGATMPFIWPHLALMPDAHHGKGATVGSVIPMLGAIMPAAVGVDIGCGMIAVRTDLVHEDLRGRNLAQLRESIEKAVPLSAGQYNDKLYGRKMSLNSSPHGAGRRLSRGQARKAFAALTWTPRWTAWNGAAPTPSSTSTRTLTSRLMSSWPMPLTW